MKPDQSSRAVQGNLFLSTQDGARRAIIVKAWKRWFLLWVPLMAVVMTASIWLDFSLILAILLAILAATLTYQRVVNGRSWRSILWGVHARRE